MGTSIYCRQDYFAKMPILSKTKGGGRPPATANFEFIEVPSCNGNIGT